MMGYERINKQDTDLPKLSIGWQKVHKGRSTLDLIL